MAEMSEIWPCGKVEKICAVSRGLNSPTWCSNQVIPSQYTRKARQPARAAPVYWAATRVTAALQVELLARLRETVITGLRWPPETLLDIRLPRK